jgi:GGDEF domain-containing protein
MTGSWTDERLAVALDREDCRIERLRDDGLRGDAALQCARLLGALHQERVTLASIGETIERAALQDDVAALAQAQQQIQEHRERTRALQAQLQALSADAHIDLLTQCVDRVGFEQALAREWDRAARDGTSVGLVVIDAGADASPAGDTRPADTLRAIGRAVQAVVAGPGTVVARVASTQFAALVPQAQLGEILAVGERVRTARQEYASAGEALAVGVAALEPSAAAGVEVLVERAEAAVARAAATGRVWTVAAGADGFFVPQVDPGRSSAQGPAPRRGR